MRTIGCLSILFLSLLTNVCSYAGDGDYSQELFMNGAHRFASDDEQKILHSLSKRIRFECDAMPLNEAIEQLSQFIDRDIFLDEHALEEDGTVSVDSEVTLKLGEITAWQALHFLLKPLNLTWLISDGILVVTTEAAEETADITRTHDVRKICRLLMPITGEKFLKFRRAKIPEGVMGGFLGAHGIGQGNFNVPPEQVPRVVIGEQPEREFPAIQKVLTVPEFRNPTTAELILAHAICDHSSLLWEERIGPGMGGTIAIGEGTLIISQTFQGHLEIAGLLSAFERVLEGQAPGNFIIARKPGYPVEEDARISAILATTKLLEIEQDSLAAVLMKIATDNNFPIWFDQQALDEQGNSSLSNSCPRRRFREVRLGSCLKKILEPHELTYLVEEGTVVVTTMTKAEQMMRIGIYDVGQSAKITRHEQLEGLIPVLRNVSRGRDYEQGWDDDNSFASFVSDRHLVVRQTYHALERISRFVDEMVVKKQIFPMEQIQLEMEIRVFTARDLEAANDLERILPQLLEGRWNPAGSLHRVGATLIVKQPLPVLDGIEEIMTKIDQSLGPKDSKAITPVDDITDQPVINREVEEQEK